MQLLIKVGFLIIFFFGLSSIAIQTDWQKQENFLSHRALGAACNSIRNIRIDPPCNPAFLGQNTEDTSQVHEHELVNQDHRTVTMKAQQPFVVQGQRPVIIQEELDGLLAAQFLLGDTYDYFYKNRALFDDPNKRDLVAELLSQKGSVGLDSSVQMWWKQNPFVFGIEPLRLHSYSEVINSAYPDIYLEGIYQQSFYFQYGTNIKNTFLNQDTFLGIQVRFLERQVISEHFYLFDALTNLDDYFQVQKQKAILIEPGFSWDLSSENSEWNPMLNAKFSQIGYVDHKIESLPIKTYADFGISIAPSVFSKNFETAINYRTNSDKEVIQNLSLASSLSVSWIQIYLGIEKDTQSIGVSTRFRNWSSGIIFQKQKSLLEGAARDISFLEFRILI
jgi:hypothetical protein